MSEAIKANPTGLYEAALGQKNCAYYIEKFEKFDQEGIGIKVSWNWSAFFFGGIWALYRKMYGWFFGWWFVVTVLAVFKTIPNAAIQLTLAAVVLACWLGFAVFANSFYHSKIKARIANASKANADAAVVDSRLDAKSRIHSWVPIVFGAIPVVGIVAAVAIPAYVDKGKAHTVFSSAEATLSKHLITETNNNPINSPAPVVEQGDTEDLKDSLRTILRTVGDHAAPPVPVFRDSESRILYLRWLGVVKDRLAARKPMRHLQREFLQAVWYESRRAGLDPTLAGC